MPGEFPRYSSEDLKKAKMEEARILSSGGELDEEGRLKVTEKSDTIEGAKKEMTGVMSYRNLEKVFTYEQIDALEGALRKIINDHEYWNSNKGEPTEKGRPIQQIQEIILNALNNREKK